MKYKTHLFSVAGKYEKNKHILIIKSVTLLIFWYHQAVVLELQHTGKGRHILLKKDYLYT